MASPGPGEPPRIAIDEAPAAPQRPRFSSPMRQHRRRPSAHREVKETLNARVEFSGDEVDGQALHRVNQYCLWEEIGRGSYGAVHRATDQFGSQYAVKEISKSRLRKRAQSHLLRKGPHRLQPNNRPAHGRVVNVSAQAPTLGRLRASEQSDALFLVRSEIAIMKKLNHPNLVQLIEVLDDPEGDSLYMVLEMCQKGVVTKVGLHEQADPCADEACRHWFRDLILAIEYLHTQGVIHRDIKPDNLLLSADDVLKVADFGVSEMFEKVDGEMKTTTSAGSPAFLPPELCSSHKEVSGKAADIWSMGVSLYCLRYGRVPFDRDSLLEMYEAIKTEKVLIPEDEDADFAHLLSRILEKDPDKRITMSELRKDAWVTRRGTDELLSTEENCGQPVEPPNELELNRALTRRMNHLLCVMRAIQRFRSLLAGVRSRAGGERVKREEGPCEVPASDLDALLYRRRHMLLGGGTEAPSAQQVSAEDEAEDSGGKSLFLGIGTGARDDFAMDRATPNVVSESPTGVDFNVYDRAYGEAIQRQKARSAKATLYLTRFVKEQEHFKSLGGLVDGMTLAATAGEQGGMPSPSPDGDLVGPATGPGIAGEEEDKEAERGPSTGREV